MAGHSSIDERLERIGMTLVALGALVVAFACYQLWGTGVLEQQAQRRLDAELVSKLTDTTPSRWHTQLPDNQLRSIRFSPGSETEGRVDDGPSLGSSSEPLPASQQPQSLLPPPAKGEVLGRIEIPSIGISKVISQGVDRDTLRQGPGHYPSSALPGQRGNVAIAGHRTTHGAPFFDLDQVAPGDFITLETLDGVFTYEVEAHQGPDGDDLGHVIVDPSAVEVIADKGDDRLTLTACHPQYSARQRIVVSALLVDGPALDLIPSDQVAPPVPLQPGGHDSFERPEVDPTDLVTWPATTVTATSAIQGNAANPIGIDSITRSTPLGHDLGAAEGEANQPEDDSLGWQADEADPTAMWATVLVLIAHAGWACGRLWRPRLAYLATAPVAVVPLFLFFVHLDRLLPAF